MRKNFALLGLLFLASYSALARTPAARQRPIALTRVKVIDTTGGPALTDLTVAIRGDRIVEMGKSGKVRVPPGSEVVDATGKFLPPGLWEMDVLRYEQDYLPLFIANGVTGARITIGYAENYKWRKQVEAGRLLGPRMVVTSRWFDGPEAVGPYFLRITSAKEASQAVIIAQKYGADLIALGFQAVTHGHMDPAEFAFVRIGETTADQVEKTCGKPWLAYETSIFDGEIDPFISDDEPEHYAWQLQQSKKTGKKLITVYVLEYRNPRFTSEYAKFVFRDGKLEYAMLPTTIWERSATGIKLAHGAPPTVRKIPVHAFDFQYTAELWSYPELGIAYFRNASAVFEAKVVFSPEKRK